jgi:NADPH:quinone reductase-like Zn-dependent oxidoreductase
VQLASRHAGATVTGVCGTARLDYVKSLGAAAVIDYTREDVVECAETYDVIIDVLGKSTFATYRRILAPQGRLVFLSFKVRQILQMLWTWIGGGQRVVCALVSERQEHLVEIRRLMEAGTLRTVVGRSFSLDQAAEAHRYAESGAKTGAVVIRVAPPAAP